MESLEWRTTLSVVLSESMARRWQQVARQQHIMNNSAMAAFLLKHYDKTCATPMPPPTSFCSACGSSLDQFCASCFSLAPKLHQQVANKLSALPVHKSYTYTTDSACL
ncbi:uncharacterized protein LOC143301560 [Babylonia areolata]|uniref:uncharacterized protein LOC143301560 n=1 Tax=Babylonia areolata TaxID=304850 RepID=UPI003FD1AF87